MVAIPAGTMVSGRYRIVSLLGEGGFGAVYLAEDIRLGNKRLAVKESFDQSPEAQEQFRLEAQLLANLKHPGLPSVTDYFIEPDGRQFLVMDYVEGEDLDRLVIRLGRPLGEREAAGIMLQVCEAVAYLHTRKPQPIIHRDIKPANVKITPDGRAILVDFGIAKVFHPQKGTAKAAKAVTPYFSSPEQHTGRTDTRSDVYSLGSMFYFIVCGDLPPDAMDRLNLGTVLVSPRQMNPSISPALEGIILTAIQIEPGRRFLNANRMAAALRSFLAGQPVILASDTVYCPRCGAPNRRGARFCIRDGTPLSTAAVPQPVAAPPAMAQTLASPGRGGSPVVQPSPSFPSAQGLFDQAVRQVNIGDCAGAIQNFESALAQGFETRDLYYHLGACYQEVGRLADAARLLEKGAGLYSKDGEIRYQLARAYRDLDQNDKAIAALGQATAFSPQDAKSFQLLGELLYGARRFGEAIHALERAVSVEPDNAASRLVLGQAYSENGEHRRALAELQRAVQIDPKNFRSQLWLGVVLHRLRKYRDAVETLKAAIQIDPGSASAQYWTGESWLQLGYYERALPFLEKAAALSPKEPGYLTRLGQCYSLLNRKGDAIKALKKALKASPNYRPAQDLLKKL